MASSCASTTCTGNALWTLEQWKLHSTSHCQHADSDIHWFLCVKSHCSLHYYNHEEEIKRKEHPTPGSSTMSLTHIPSTAGLCKLLTQVVCIEEHEQQRHVYSWQGVYICYQQAWVLFHAALTDASWNWLVSLACTCFATTPLSSKCPPLPLTLSFLQYTTFHHSSRTCMQCCFVRDTDTCPKDDNQPSKHGKAKLPNGTISSWAIVATIVYSALTCMKLLYLVVPTYSKTSR